MRARVAALLLVALGGAAGSVARAGVTLAIPGAPLAATLVVNVVGAFALALLVGVLDGAGPGPGEEERRPAQRQRHRHRARLLLGTGFCGGFTTYSAVALQSAELIGDSAPLVAAAYMLGTLVVGTLATVAGLVLAGLVLASRSVGARW